MADQKVSDLPSLNGADVDAADLLYIVDSSAGTAGSKKITIGQYQLAPYSAGTANGVMYLNGSNVMTTGSGLVFDGANLAVGTSTTTNAKIFSFVNDATLPGLGVRQDGAGPIQIWQGSGGNERARITSGGDLLVGATAAVASERLLVSATGSDATIRISNNTSGNAVLKFAAEGVDGGDVYYERSTSRLYVKNSASGGVYLSTNATAWTAVSDERFKTALIPIEDAATKVSSLRAVTGRYKTDAEDVSRSFLIAQDVQAVFPEAVNADNPNQLGLSYTDMVPLLVAAIKEQQAIINELRARVAALEAQ